MVLVLVGGEVGVEVGAGLQGAFLPVSLHRLLLGSLRRRVHRQSKQAGPTTRRCNCTHRRHHCTLHNARCTLHTKLHTTPPPLHAATRCNSLRRAATRRIKTRQCDSQQHGALKQDSATLQLHSNYTQNYTQRCTHVAHTVAHSVVHMLLHRRLHRF